MQQTRHVPCIAIDNPLLIVMQHGEKNGLAKSVSSTRPSMEVEKSSSTIHGFILARHDIEPGGRKQRKIKMRKYVPIKSKNFSGARRC